jgi:L-alanine-DL-glutamate epimerase-like enolase superfamily enzyme
MIDIPWNGFSQSKKVGDLAEVYQLNMSPHNYYSHLASFISASLCAVLPNVRIMEIDIDDVLWKDELVTNQPQIVDGYMQVPTGPGWGTDLNEDALRAHPWGKGKSNW